MLKIKTLTIKNFLSIGNVSQAVDFTASDLVLVLGENLDQSGSGNKNGVGKSALVNAISYALYGTALTNIKKDNLINKSNPKNMLVTIAFEVNGIDYKIERGRKPGVFRFYKNGVISQDTSAEADPNDSQGENRHTQDDVVTTLGITHEMFKHIVALNTYTEPFLAMRANDQRTIIEQLLGITKLTEKSEKLKELAKDTKDQIKEEEFKISADKEANKRIQENIDTLKEKSAEWDTQKQDRLDKLQVQIVGMLDLDIDAEIAAHKSKKDSDDLHAELRALSRELTSIERQITDVKKSITKLDNDVNSTKNKICPTCNQSMDTSTHEHVHNKYLEERAIFDTKFADLTKKQLEIKELQAAITTSIPKELPIFYTTIDDAYNHKTLLDTLEHTLTQELNSTNPYTDQIDSLKQTGLKELSFDSINELNDIKDHHDLLLKLLSNKDSFIRKKIIDQNLSYLNHRLAQYLTDVSLPHKVLFKSDLEVEITMFGKDFDFDSLSRGERTRLILSLSWAFRDVYENMTNKINLLFIDELIDGGLDSAGVESSLAVLKKMARDHNRNIFLISHRDELTSRVTNIMKVIKSGGFTTFESPRDNI